MPKKVKFRKQQRGRRSGPTKGGANVDFGDFGLMALECCWITNRQIEASRVAINRHIKRGGKLWIRIFPDKPYTKKPLETRMGKGKGNLEGWVAVVKPGRVLFELEGRTIKTHREFPRPLGPVERNGSIAENLAVKDDLRVFRIQRIALTVLVVIGVGGLGHMPCNPGRHQRITRNPPLLGNLFQDFHGASFFISN